LIVPDEDGALSHNEIRDENNDFQYDPKYPQGGFVQSVYKFRYHKVDDSINGGEIKYSENIDKYQKKFYK